MGDEERMSFLLEKYSQLSTDAIVDGLSEHYIRSDFQGSFNDLEDVGSVKPLLFKMIHRMAALEADNFLMKLCLATGQRYVAAPSLNTADASEVFDQLLPRPPATRSFLTSRLVELRPEVIGTGWHLPEQHPDGSYWRWSGPDRMATLVLPTVGSGVTRLSFDGAMLVPSDIDSTSFFVDGRPASNVTVTPLENRRFSVSLEATVSQRRTPSFFMLRIEVPQTVSPAEIDGFRDGRLLGIGLGKILLELIEPDAVPHLEEPT